MPLLPASFSSSSSWAAARAGEVSMLGSKKCKRVAYMAAGLLMVKKSKKRNPI